MRLLQLISFASVFLASAEAAALSCKSSLYDAQQAVKYSGHFFYAIDILFFVIAMTLAWQRVKLLSQENDKIYDKTKPKQLAKALIVPVLLMLIPLGHILFVNIKIAACSINIP